MAEYDEGDLARDLSQNRQMAMFIAALSAQRGVRTSALIARANKVEEHLNKALPRVTPVELQQCDRETPHRRHRWYGDLDDRVQCEGVAG